MAQSNEDEKLTPVLFRRNKDEDIAQLKKLLFLVETSLKYVLELTQQKPSEGQLFSISQGHLPSHSKDNHVSAATSRYPVVQFAPLLRMWTRHQNNH